MAEILKEWLTERLQRPMKWEAEEFGETMKNGYIVASVLYSYHVINDEKMFLIRPSIANVDVRNNWQYLNEWLRQVDVFLSDSELNNIMDGKSSALLRLFYQLFLHLDKRDRTNFLKAERKMVSNLVEKLGSRFVVEKVDEDKESAVDHLSKPLLNEKHFIEWQKKKSAEVKETYDYVRHKYNKMLEKIKEEKIPCWPDIPSNVNKLSSRTKSEMQKFELKYPCKYENYTYEQLMSLDEKCMERKKAHNVTEWAETYMDNLYQRLNLKSDSEEFQKQIRSTLSNSLWDLSVGEEESRVDMEVAMKVMRLSQFEKQMCTKIMETKQQARNLTKNRIDAEREFAEQRDHLFNQYLDSLKEQIHLDVVEIDYEKHRLEKLHQKLYAEKMKRKRQHYYEICYETMLSIVDYATKYAYFTRLLGGDIPNHYTHEWKTLFFKKQPIFDILEPIEDLLKEHQMEEELVPEEEEIIRLELDRQDALNDSEFKEYHNYWFPWTLDLLIPNYDPESEERKYEHLGGRILGHVVFTLLAIKYPPPPPMPRANLPNFPIKALVRGLPDKSITIAMQMLLNKSKIHVVRLEPAINFCLRKYKYEMIGCTDIEVAYDKFINSTQEEEGKEFIKSLKADDEMFSKSSSGNVTASAAGGPTAANCKQTQTPKTLPEEDMVLSTAAELGKYAFDALSMGEALTDHLLSAMIVEYIKDQEGINGFVIINYPNTYREAQILEETFSGLEPPPESSLEDRDDIYLEESIIKHRRKEKDPFKEIRVSKLVIDPHKSKFVKPFESYFTCYLKLKETEDILQEYVIWDMTEDNSELIDRFYALLGMNYSLYYEVIEKDFLAQMCKYILGDLSSPPKSNEELFGEGVLSLLDFPTSEDKRMKAKMVKPDVSVTRSAHKMRHGGRLSKSNSQNIDIVKSFEVVQDTREEQASLEEAIEEEAEANSESTYVEPVVLPGEVDWDYGELPISQNIGLALASFWEEVEKSYINDMEKMFFCKRMQMNYLIPYTRFIKDKMEQIITLPSCKQDLVSNFQKEYNDFEDDWRCVNLTKSEWHCRIKELQRKLHHICDERKIYAEQQRQLLIMENWVSEELTTMANTYISCMQAELNRTMLTFQVLYDFYYTLLKKLPSSDKVTPKELIKIYKEADESTGGKKNVEDKVYRQLKAAFQDLQLSKVRIDFENNPLNIILENNVKYAMKIIKDANEHYRSVISREYSEFAKMVIPTKKKDDTISDDSLCSGEIFRNNGLKCIEEWIMGINGEMYRANLRMLVLQHKCHHDMKLFNDNIFDTFEEVQNDINTYYMNELKSVDRLCKYFQLAVENCRKIPETLILEHDVFIIDPNLIQFAVPEPEPPLIQGELINPLEFKVNQLSRLRSQFKLVAPTGIALQQAFIYLIQDFIFFGKESCEGPLFPELWKQVDPEQVPKLVLLLFGETAYVDWRDFLIYCLNIRFPNVDELLDLRKRFRRQDFNCTEQISRDTFLNEELWFESQIDPDDKQAQLRKTLVKHFLFELFETAENKMNYSAFLLSFCKSEDPIEGFTTALSMAIGKKTCFVLDECEDVVCKMIMLKEYRDECLACANKCAEAFLEKLIDTVLNFCEGINISEVELTESDLALNKKLSKKKSVKGKKPDQSSSRSDKTKSDNQSINKKEEDVKKTYICRPCDEVPVEDKIVEEEEKMEALDDQIIPEPDLAYTVSQAVIWNILEICLPWHFKLIPQDKPTPYKAVVQEVLKLLETKTENGDIFVSMFVNHPQICKFFNKIKKFTALNLAEEVRKVCF